ncbi:MAG: Fur family transcriptional regulator [Acidimicrobiia bacterium]
MRFHPMEAPAVHVLTTPVEHHLKVTPQRFVTWRALVDSPPHSSIYEVFDAVSEALPTTTLRTVYETLHRFEQLGLVRLLHLPGGARVELEPVDHAHGYCERCGAVVNLSLRAPRASDAPGSFHLRVEEDVAFGLCERCYERTGPRT